METPVTGDFFKLEKPKFEGVSKELLEGVKKSYTKEVVDAISESGTQHGEHCVKLANFITPEWRTVLARQRRDYGISEEFKAKFPVEKQASNPDDTPINNISMERNLATVDYRLQKLRTLEAVSRSVILDKTKERREKSMESFRSYRKEEEKKVEISLKWSKRMKEKFSKGLDEKMIIGEKKGYRLAMLEQLKKDGVPFTNSSTTLPKTGPLFRIQVTQPNKGGLFLIFSFLLAYFSQSNKCVFFSLRMTKGFNSSYCFNCRGGKKRG